MRLRQTLSVLALLVVGVSAYAQQPERPGDVTVPPSRPHPTVAKSDQHRIVGKVLDVDQQKGVVKLATEDEGTVVVPASTMRLRAFRVGETVSVPRPGTDSPSALPRQ